MLKREDIINEIKNNNEFDVIVIGGGSVGVGTAVDCSSRGLRVLLLEKKDFAKETSSRSTKLLHGGVRYLAQLHFHLVMDSLRERELLLKNAPHLAKHCEFIIPCYTYFDLIFYRMGLFLYDLLGGFPKGHCSYVIGKSKLISKYPNVKKKGLVGGIVYSDATFDDARLALELANTASSMGAKCLNYAEVVSLHKDENQKISGLDFIDSLTSSKYSVKSKCIINATGIFSDSIRLLDSDKNESIVTPSQGVHIMFNKDLFNSSQSMVVPKTSDGRVLFTVPWHNAVIVGTTDTGLPNPVSEPFATTQEVDFIMENLNSYLEKKVTKDDILSVYAGIRPLIKQNKESTSGVSREEHIEILDSNLISLVGGKWTAYRRICEKLVDHIIKNTKLINNVKSKTKNIVINNYLSIDKLSQIEPEFRYYGEAYEILESHGEDFNKLISSKYVYNYAQVRYAVEHEYALTLEDVLARRIRLLFVDAKCAIDVAREVAIYMGKMLNWDANKINQEVEDFTKIANNYLKNNYL